MQQEIRGFRGKVRKCTKCILQFMKFKDLGIAEMVYSCYNVLLAMKLLTQWSLKRKSLFVRVELHSL
jgi:hypothetical protein